MNKGNKKSNSGDRLSNLVYGLNLIERDFSRSDPLVKGICYDSRLVEGGYVFVAIKGERENGNRFVDQAISNGAVAIVSEEKPAGRDLKNICWLRTDDSREALSALANEFYVSSWKNITLVGVTGTNGKTTVTYLLKSVFDSLGHPSGVIGTIGYLVGGLRRKAVRTTPEAPEIHAYIREMIESGSKFCAMEISSHSLELKRVSSFKFDVAVFTNLTAEHLDYHGTMEKYYQAKKKLFYLLKDNGLCVVNIDDEFGNRLAEELNVEKIPVFTFGRNEKADLNIESFTSDRSGSTIKFKIGGIESVINSPLIGRPNVYNVMTAFGVAYKLGVDRKAAIRALEKVDLVDGRMQQISTGQDFNVIIDYAHTPDALMNLLITVREFTEGDVITVFGCGGDRDRTKRPVMGKHALELSDRCFITSDNPRSEDPKTIIDEILAGMGSGASSGKCRVVEDRRKAIHSAIMLADAGDTVIIAGKGHEDYQILGGEIIHFNDSEEALKALEERFDFKG